MFGYVTINENELKIREYKRYRSFYCGLCRSLKTRYGIQAQVILPNDMIFLSILLNGLYEKPLEEEDRRCIAHPARKQHMVYNEITDYAADMGVLLAYYKCRDDVEDEKSVRAGAMSGLLKRHVKTVTERWPRQAEAVRSYIEGQRAFERKGEYDLDAAAAFSGVALGEIFVMQEDEWADELRRMGFYLGKFVYLMDGFEDLDKDLKKQRYNPWTNLSREDDYDASVENVLTMMMAACAKEFEKLPIVQDIEILRNIIYSGVWVKYAEIRKKKDENS